MEQVPQTQSHPVMVSELEEQIIRACCLYLWMTILDMAYLLDLPTSLNFVRKVAALLSGKNDKATGHYLYRFALPQRAGGNALRVFVPGEASRDLLQQEKDAEGFIWKEPSTMQRYSYSFVLHNLGVTRFCICASVFCRKHPEYYLAETRLSYEMARNPPRISQMINGKETPLPVIPDCWLFIERVEDGKGTALWVEVDNQTTYRVAFQRRLSARIALIDSDTYSSHFGTPARLLCYAVLSKTPNLKRDRMHMHTLRRWSYDLVVKEKREHLTPVFRFTVLDYETLYQHPETVFSEPSWCLLGDPEHEEASYTALLPPAEP